MYIDQEIDITRKEISFLRSRDLDEFDDIKENWKTIIELEAWLDVLVKKKQKAQLNEQESSVD